jgi:acyl dehydratase
MTYRPTAVNHSHASENRIHADDVAKRYGFAGGLVPGVAVFGYMTHEITAALGADWLAHGVADLRLIKPAYEGDRLAIDLEQGSPTRYSVECRNAQGVLLATIAVDVPRALPAVDPRAHVATDARDPERIEIALDRVEIDAPFERFVWQPTAEQNRQYTDWVADDLPIYRTGVLHPHLIQHMANQVLVRRFYLPAWVHVGTEMRFRRALKLGDAVEMRTTPIEKWERKGHHFIKLYIAYVVDGQPAVEAYHTAIIKLAERAA